MGFGPKQIFKIGFISLLGLAQIGLKKFVMGWPWPFDETKERLSSIEFLKNKKVVADLAFGFTATATTILTKSVLD